ncbi:glycosyltransferase [Candidatus Parcubacteria bacterium]|jgi:N-acetylglucosaminyldiphosphoundecaprenol N-acetyl-beta-D-mannosaminyltransferase|nr:MAG: glycosyltransferase [Candidatus Parcubacteria bacterium]
MQRINYKGFNIDLGEKPEIAKNIENFLLGERCRQILTLNPEFMVLASKKPELLEVNNQADLILIDGVGLAWAVKWAFKTSVFRHPGADLVLDICALAESRNLKIGVLIPKGGLSSPERISSAMQKLFPRLDHQVFSNDADAIRNINAGKIQILFLTLGQPNQEVWIQKNRTQLKTCKVAVGVGGAFDFLTGARQRAPRFLRRIGLEWLWRLITQPWRFGRIWRATFGFWNALVFKL